VPLQVPYEDIFIHPDDYFDTASYGKDFIQDPYQAPFLKVMKLAVALTDHEFHFYDPEEIDTRRRTLARSKIRDDSTLGTDPTNGILVDSDDDESGQLGNDTDDSEGDFIILQPQKRIKIADSDAVEEIEDGSESEDSKVEVDELQEDETQNEKGNIRFEVREDMDMDELEEDKGEKRKTMSANSENGEVHVICCSPLYVLTATRKGRLMITRQTSRLEHRSRRNSHRALPPECHPRRNVRKQAPLVHLRTSERHPRIARMVSFILSVSLPLLIAIRQGLPGDTEGDASGLSPDNEHTAANTSGAPLPVEELPGARPKPKSVPHTRRSVRRGNKESATVLRRGTRSSRKRVIFKVVRCAVRNLCP
jgi:hypothetical protein